MLRRRGPQWDAAAIWAQWPHALAQLGITSVKGQAAMTPAGKHEGGRAESGRLSQAQSRYTDRLELATSLLRLKNEDAREFKAVLAQTGLSIQTAFHLVKVVDLSSCSPSASWALSLSANR